MDAYISFNMNRGMEKVLPSGPVPRRELPFPEVKACGRIGKEKGATGEPATPS
ncbi:hypothetical protein NUKP84_42380 [Klebsiella variicola]|nr:hypothetical protein NUKP84_42380 [Klebsiella variicola]